MAAIHMKRAWIHVRFLLLCVLGTPLFVVVSVLARTACLLPALRRPILSLYLTEAEKVAPGVLTTPEQCYQELYEMTSPTAWKGILSIEMIYLEAEVFEGGKATDPSLVRLDGSSCRLLQFARAARPLVISFGSNT
ncbi:Hypp2429 [Branchiostoma lanceolatum]|uniref:Hypp2429 protein n=1 Tax=Branchiostoma lanceolatum TaxID=7740 RepID=A0A8J9ZT38_BRALA|nr:Hypp2429 [Branchiostoma lanceolatum]